MRRIGVLASGEGTNLQALLDTIHGAPIAGAGTVPTATAAGGAHATPAEAPAGAPAAPASRETLEVVAVASDKPTARALERAAAAGVTTAVFLREDFPDRVARDLAMADWLEAQGVDLLVLAGYMAILESAFIGRFRDRIVNVHPSLLPAFPGIRAVEQALDAGVKVFGVTVHLVDEGVDTGPIILQRAIELPDATDPAGVLAALRPLEHTLLPEAVLLLAAGRVRRDPANPRRTLIAR